MNETASSPIKILIVDDDFLYVMALKGFLQEALRFLVVGEAKDGQTAITLADELSPDVIIIDIRLPVISGLQAIKKIKEKKPDIKILAITVFENEDEAIEALSVGATAYVNKDIDIKSLETIIESVNKGAIWISPLMGKRVLLENIRGYKKS